MALADDLAGFIAEHELKNSTVIGHSMYEFTKPCAMSHLQH
jgi:hypothetical protein